MRYRGPKKVRARREWLARMLGVPVKTEESFGEGVLRRASVAIERGAMEVREVFITGVGPVDVSIRLRREEDQDA